MRLDVFLVECGLFDSRQKAKEAIQSRIIELNGTITQKPSFEVSLDSTPQITILEPHYVSRAAYKLKGFFDEIDFKKQHFKAIDVGAARGGFTQILLEYGAREVWSIDVGSNQLHPLLRQNPNVKVYEHCDIRDFAKTHAQINPQMTPKTITQARTHENNSYVQFDLLVCDVSFIEISKIFDALQTLSDEMILLFKPQFEVGKVTKRNKKGVVQDRKLIDDTLATLCKFIQTQGFRILTITPSTLKGKEGNEEFFIHTKKQ